MKNKNRYLFATLIAFTILFSSLLTACQKEPYLYQFLSELRSNVYYGEMEDIKIKACYGFTEKARINDGAIGGKAHYFSFYLLDKETENVTYSLSVNIGGKNYTETFSLNPVTSRLTATIYTDEILLNEFTLILSFGSNKKEILLSSILPKNTISAKDALYYLEEKQPDLISTYKNQDGEFNAEVVARILVKDEKPFWYVSFIRGRKDVKALLIDGINGEVLAVRSIF